MLLGGERKSGLAAAVDSAQLFVIEIKPDRKSLMWTFFRARRRQLRSDCGLRADNAAMVASLPDVDMIFSAAPWSALSGLPILSEYLLSEYCRSLTECSARPEVVST
jgi:hypothetical protein